MRTKQQHLRWRRRRGVALVLVIAIVAVASIMGMAMLSTSSLHAQIGSNAKEVALAESVADAGLEYATHKLLEMTEYDVYHSNYWTSDGAKTITFGGDWNASAQISIRKYSAANPEDNSTDHDEQYYEITSTSSVTTPSGGVISRTLKSRVNVELEFRPKTAVTLGEGMTLPLSLYVNGNLRAPRDVTLQFNGASRFQNGKIYARSLSAVSLSPSARDALFVDLPDDEPSPGVPTTVKDYTVPYTHEGVDDCQPQSIPPDGAVVVPLTAVPAKLSNNPAGIYYVNGDITLGDGFDLNGTLYVTGKVYISGQGINIRAQSGFPALVVHDEIILKGTGRKCNAYGLVWVKNQIAKEGISAAGSELNVFGSLQLPKGAKIDIGTSLTAGKINVTFRQDLVKVPDFATKNRIPARVRVVDYGLVS